MQLQLETNLMSLRHLRNVWTYRSGSEYHVEWHVGGVEGDEDGFEGG